MPLHYVLDEHLRGLPWRAIHKHNSGGINVIDVVRVGDPPDLPLQSTNPVLLRWAEREGRILVSRDYKTMPLELANHLTLDTILRVYS